MTKVKDTSLEAYNKLLDSGKISEAQQRVLNVIYKCNYAGLFINYHEIIEWTKNRNDRKRLSELEKMGLIKKVDVQDGCSTYQFVPDPAEQKRLRELHATKKPEMERFAAWLHKQRLKQHGENWYGKVNDKMGEYSHSQLVKAFKQSEKLTDQIIF